MYIYMYVYIYTYICIYTHAHTVPSASFLTQSDHFYVESTKRKLISYLCVFDPVFFGVIYIYTYMFTYIYVYMNIKFKKKTCHTVP